MKAAHDKTKATFVDSAASPAELEARKPGREGERSLRRIRRSEPEAMSKEHVFQKRNVIWRWCFGCSGERNVCLPMYVAHIGPL